MPFVLYFLLQYFLIALSVSILLIGGYDDGYGRDNRGGGGGGYDRY